MTGAKPISPQSVPAVFARRLDRSRHATALTAADTPRLEQFPSSRPLSPEEEALARYVRVHPQEARLLARAQKELLKRDLAEFENRYDSPQPVADSAQ
jgi:hypothetical protein